MKRAMNIAFFFSSMYFVAAHIASNLRVSVSFIIRWITIKKKENVMWYIKLNERAIFVEPKYLCVNTERCVTQAWKEKRMNIHRRIEDSDIVIGCDQIIRSADCLSKICEHYGKRIEMCSDARERRIKIQYYFRKMWRADRSACHYQFLLHSFRARIDLCLRKIKVHLSAITVFGGNWK